MSDSPATTERLSGSCLCGASTFTVANTPLRMVICHCTNCKKWSGSAFATNVHFPRSALKHKNDAKISIYRDGDTESSRIIERYFCSGCGCPLYIIGPHKPDIVNIASGVLDGLVTSADGIPKVDESKRLAGLLPSLEVFKEGKCPWVNIKLDE